MTVLCRLALLLTGFSSLWTLPLLATERDEQRRYQDWLVVCLRQSLLCQAEVTVPHPNHADVPAFQLRLQRYDGSSEVELVFIPLNALPDLDERIYFTIDRQVPFEAQPGTGWHRQGELNEYSFENRLVRSMLPLFKAGRRLRVSYANREGGETAVDFSLMGLTAALRYMDSKQTIAAGQEPLLTGSTVAE